MFSEGEDTVNKSEVSYDQWKYEVQAVMDLHPEPSQGSLSSSVTRGQAADLVRYLGPEAGVKEVLDKLEMHYAVLSDYHVLMNQFHLICQEKSERVSAVVTRIEGALNKGCIRYPSKEGPWEMEEHLRDGFLYGLRNPVKDSLRYLFGNAAVDYAHLLIVARKN